VGAESTTVLWLLGCVRHELALFAGVGFLLFGIESFLFDLMWLVRHGWRSATVYRRHDRITMATLPAPDAPGRFAVLMGAWDEAAVIGTTITLALERWGDADFCIYVATYPNDPATQAAIEAARALSPAAADRVRIVPGDRPGPTTKAEALNRAWAALMADEAAAGEPVKAIVLHDAEDFVHRDELRLFDRLIERFALVQIPVRPLKRAGHPGVAGHYLDEFAEAHGKQLVIREAVGASVPCAGTGCAVERGMAGRLAAERGGAPFDSESLTEDYELGLRIGALGGRGILARLLERPGGPLVAVEAYFPHRGAVAVRQKARWVTGIALAGWDRMGWRGGVREHWMRVRDRSAPVAAAVLAAGYLALLVAGAESLLAWSEGRPAPVVAEVKSPLAWVLAGLLVWRLGCGLAGASPLRPDGSAAIDPANRGQQSGRDRGFPAGALALRRGRRTALGENAAQPARPATAAMSASRPVRFLVLLLTGWGVMRTTILYGPTIFAPAPSAEIASEPVPTARAQERTSLGAVLAPFIPASLDRAVPVRAQSSRSHAGRRSERRRHAGSIAGEDVALLVQPLPLQDQGGVAGQAPETARAATSPADEPASRPPPQGNPIPAVDAGGSSSRWSGFAYIFHRPDSGRANPLAPAGQLGGSQAAARIAYRLDAEDGSRWPRVSRPRCGPRAARKRRWASISCRCPAPRSA
jgi:adsorption protein B